MVTVAQWTAALPTAYQYFAGQPTLGGLMAEADYCPHFTGWSNGLCADTRNAPLPSENYRAQAYGASSLCLEVPDDDRTSSLLTFP
jgi:hypothetical protein